MFNNHSISGRPFNNVAVGFLQQQQMQQQQQQTSYQKLVPPYTTGTKISSVDSNTYLNNQTNNRVKGLGQGGDKITVSPAFSKLTNGAGNPHQVRCNS